MAQCRVMWAMKLAARLKVSKQALQLAMCFIKVCQNLIAEWFHGKCLIEGYTKVFKTVNHL